MVENLSDFFSTDDFAETVTVNGASVVAIFDVSTELALGEALTLGPSLLLPASAVPAAAAGQPAVVRGVAYQVREVRLQPPDGMLVRLMIVRV